ncbi:MAG: TetR/AcrR family transcriptional regulator [Bacteroidia bacterium]|nr:TetR/AcrR family transcriptional regulator [Bacteroidia bacterium]
MGRKSKASLRKQEILSHFYEVIIEEGFEGASIAKIAKRMDVNPSLLIHYFATKDGMVLGLIDYIIETYSTQIFPDFSGTQDPSERWEDVLDVVSRIQWSRIIDNSVFYSCYTLTFRNIEIKRRFKDLYKGIINTLAYEVEYASKAGVIEVKNSIQAAEFMISLIEGTNYYQYVSPFGMEADDRAERTKNTIRTVLSGNRI